MKKEFLFACCRRARQPCENVHYTNFCDVSLFTDPRTGTFGDFRHRQHGKGAAGQAVQNMNLSFGLQETMGLKLVPPAF